MTETINLAKMGDGAVWHVLTGYVTDDIAKTACGIRRAPTAVEPGVDSRAVRHRGANVCANCRGQLDNRTTTEGGTTMTDLTDDLQTRASEAADAADGDEAPRADTKPEKDTKGRGGTATATKPRTRKAATTPRSSGNGDKPLSAIKAAEEVLRKEGKPLHVKELTQRILAMPNTRLGGKTPDATVGAILAVNIKKPDSIFRRTKPSTYTLKKGK